MDINSQPDWQATEAHLLRVEEAYRLLMGVHGVSVGFALGEIDRLRVRFNRGERTAELAHAINELSL